MKHTIIIILSLCAMFANAQDVIYKVNGDSITNITVVKYNKKYVTAIRNSYIITIASKKVQKICTGKQCIEYNQGKSLSNKDTTYFSYQKQQDIIDSTKIALLDELNYAGHLLERSGNRKMNALYTALATGGVSLFLTIGTAGVAPFLILGAGMTIAAITVICSNLDLIKAGQRLKLAERRIRKLEQKTAK